MISIRQALALIALVFSFALHVDVAPAAAQQTRYASTNLRLRTNATTESRAIGRIPRGAAVAVSRCASNWCSVSFGGQYGFASERYLRRTVPRERTELRAPDGRGRARVEGRRGTEERPARREGRGYTNSAGERVRSPTHSRSVPAGASARCRDGTYSFSRSRRGTCSHHGGVATWL